MHQSDNEIVMPTLPFKMWGQVGFLKIVSKHSLLQSPVSHDPSESF